MLAQCAVNAVTRGGKVGNDDGDVGALRGVECFAKKIGQCAEFFICIVALQQTRRFGGCSRRSRCLGQRYTQFRKHVQQVLLCRIEVVQVAKHERCGGRKQIAVLRVRGKGLFQRGGGQQAVPFATPVKGAEPRSKAGCIVLLAPICQPHQGFVHAIPVCEGRGGKTKVGQSFGLFDSGVILKDLLPEQPFLQRLQQDALFVSMK